jgi:hypothetical protein
MKPFKKAEVFLFLKLCRKNLFLNKKLPLRLFLKNFSGFNNSTITNCVHGNNLFS